jgi:hypothetical protein
VFKGERLEQRLVDDAELLGLVREGMEFTFSNVRQFWSLPSMSAARGHPYSVPGGTQDLERTPATVHSLLRQAELFVLKASSVQGIRHLD